MRRVLAVLALVAALFTTTALPASAITWGEPDGDDHPNVVLLIFQQTDGFYSCSGTLLSPTVVLTAGHCVESAGELNIRTWVTNDPDPLSQRLPGEGLVAFLERTFVEAESVVPHPDYADYAAFPDTFDVGLVFLPEPGIVLDDGAYGELPDEGFLDQLVTRKGATTQRQVAVVGYGRQGTLPPFEQSDLERYQGTSTITQLGRSSVTGTQTVQLTNTPGRGTGSGGTCFGDSGGPAFWIDPATGEETNIVVAVTSFGITGHCAGLDFSFRTDTAVAQDFFDAYL